MLEIVFVGYIEKKKLSKIIPSVCSIFDTLANCLQTTIALHFGFIHAHFIHLHQWYHKYNFHNFSNYGNVRWKYPSYCTEWHSQPAHFHFPIPLVAVAAAVRSFRCCQSTHMMATFATVVVIVNVFSSTALIIGTNLG